MTGPPTPPITSAIEIEDAARAAQPAAEVQATVVTGGTTSAAPGEPVAPQVAIAETPQQAATPYRQAFATLLELASAGRFEDLVAAAETADITTTQDKHLDRLLVIAPLVLSYLILDDVPPALQAITRLPDALQSHPLSRTLFALAASTSERKYGNVYSRTGEVHNVVQNTQIPGADILTLVDGLLTKFVETFRQRTIVLLARAYTSIPLTLVQSYLNCLPEQALTAATQHRWGYDASSRVFTPVPPPKGSTYGANGTITGISSLATFDLIANTNLE